MRDRLRCPKCKAVGTFKPHGGLLFLAQKRKIARWLCKFCGYYRGPEGERQAYPTDSGAWGIDETLPAGAKYLKTPKEALEASYRPLAVWPWKG